MKTKGDENGNGLIDFADLGGLDPAISSVLGTYQRQELEKNLSPEERKKARKLEQKKAKEQKRMQARKENRVTLDFPPGMKARLEEIAAEESINVSQLAAFLIAHALAARAVLSIQDYKTRSHTPKHEYNLSAPAEWWDISKGRKTKGDL